MKFEFPTIFPEEAKKDEDKAQEAVDSMKDKFKKYVDRNKARPGLPGWFSI